MSEGSRPGAATADRPEPEPRSSAPATDDALPSLTREPQGDGRAEPIHEPSGWRRTFTALRHRDFSLLMGSALPHMLAIQMSMVAFGYLAFEMTGSATALGFMGLAWGIPMLVLSLPGGVIADRFPRRTILMITQTITGVAALISAALVYTGYLQLWHLFVVAMVQGTCFAMNMPARQAMTADIVGKEDLTNALALNNANMNLTRVGGPALAGFLIASPKIGVGGVFMLMAAAYVVVVATMSFIQGGRVRAGTSRRSGVEQLMDGLRYIRGSRALIMLLTLGFVPMLLGMHYQMLMPVFALGIHQVGAQGLGILSMSAGIGALMGSLALASLGNFSGKRRLQTITGVVFGLALVGFALAPSYYIALLALPIVGAASASYMALNNTLIMEHTPREFYGRVMSVYMMTFSLMPLASLPVARLADIIGAPITVAITGGILAFVVAAIAFVSKIQAAGSSARSSAGVSG